LGFNSFARCGFFQFRKVRDRFAETDPDRSAAKWQPTSFRVKAIGSKNYARHDWDTGHVRERWCASAEWRAFEERPRAIANTAFGKNTDNSARVKPFDRGPDRFSVSAIACSWKSIHRAQKMSEPWNREKFGHRHPIDLPPHH